MDNIPSPPSFLGGVEYYGRETRGHLGVETDLDTSLDLLLYRDILEYTGIYWNIQGCTGIY